MNNGVFMLDHPLFWRRKSFLCDFSRVLTLLPSIALPFSISGGQFNCSIENFNFNWHFNWFLLAYCDTSYQNSNEKSIEVYDSVIELTPCSLSVFGLAGHDWGVARGLLHLRRILRRRPDRLLGVCQRRGPALGKDWGSRRRRAKWKLDRSWGE